MKNKRTIIFSFIFTFHFCYGQFLYTGYQQAESWLLTNNGSINVEEDSSNLWLQYRYKKKIQYKNIHHFGVFFNLHDSSISNIIQSKPLLLGNGLLTNYRFGISGIEIFNSMFFSNSKEESEKGFVRKIKDVSMYTNQAYFKYSKNQSILSYSFKLGRDFLTEGYGLGSNLFFSDYSRPFDQFLIEASYKKINGKFSAINLEPLSNYNRYLYMHSLSINLNKLSLTFGESVISTGIEESIDIKYLNPFNFWAWENLGSLDKGLNAFLYFGFTFKLKKTIRLYGEILFDDINFHIKDSYYLNRYAYLIGFQKTSFPFLSSNIWIEHSNVLNQVYQSYHPSHIYTHRGFPIGHYLGNDFINTRIHYSQLFKSLNSKLFIDFSYLIQGKNNLNTPFDNPWEDNMGNKIIGYKHPGFPTPPVTNLVDFNLGVEVGIINLTYLTISLENLKISDDVSLSKIRISFWSYIKIHK